MATQTLTIDSQVHAYERNRPERPWNGHLEGPEEVTGDDMVAAMDAVGVDGALLISPFSLYGYDASYILEVYGNHPGRFGLIRPFDSQAESVADDIAAWAATPGVVGARIMLTRDEFQADNPGLNRAFEAGAQAGFPVNVMCSGKLPLLGELARRHQAAERALLRMGITLNVYGEEPSSERIFPFGIIPPIVPRPERPRPTRTGCGGAAKETGARLGGGSGQGVRGAKRASPH